MCGPTRDYDAASGEGEGRGGGQPDAAATARDHNDAVGNLHVCQFAASCSTKIETSSTPKYGKRGRQTNHQLWVNRAPAYAQRVIQHLAHARPRSNAPTPTTAMIPQQDCHWQCLANLQMVATLPHCVSRLTASAGQVASSQHCKATAQAWPL